MDKKKSAFIKLAVIKGLMALFALSPRADAKPLLLNGTAAIVDKTLITLQDAYIFRALHRFKAGESPVLLLEEGEDLKKTVQKLVFEEMVYTEMKAVKLEGNIKSETQHWLGTEKSKNPSQARAWKEISQRFGLSEGQAIDRMVRSAQVEQFLQKKVETMTPIITEEEVQRYFKQNEARFRGNSFESLRPSIVVLLKKQSLQKSLEEWVRSLKEKYAVVSLLEAN